MEVGQQQLASWTSSGPQQVRSGRVSDQRVPPASPRLSGTYPRYPLYRVPNMQQCTAGW